MRDTRDAATWNAEEAQPDIWQRLSRLVFVLVILAAVPCVLAIFWPELEKKRQMVTQIETLERERDRLEAERDALDQRLEWIRTDREFLEIVARDRLDLHKEGEFIFRFESDKKSDKRDLVQP